MSLTVLLNCLIQNQKNPLKIHFHSPCPMMPLDFIGTLEGIESITQGEILWKVTNVETGKTLTIGSKHPQLTYRVV